MIRPVTLICWILALSAGLYLYRAKHEVELIDQHIDQIAKQTADLRVESRGLLDEWIRLGEPEQLHKYSDEYLGLQPISPGQFARLSDLPARLPAPQADPPEEQANVVAQSSGGTSLGDPSPDDQSSGNQAGIVPAEPGSAGRGQETAANADDIPVPPIPPAMGPVSATSASVATALPLQARPVTPRPADGQVEPETTRTRTAASPQGVDDPHTGVARLVTSATAAEPRQAPQGPANGQPSGQPGAQPHGLPPLQAQAARYVPGLPPPQTQGPTREVAQGPGRGPTQGQDLGRAPGQAPGQPVPRPAEARTADNRLNEPPREIRPIEAQPLQRQAAEPRGPGAEYGRQGPSQTEQAQTGQVPMAPAQGGSLLGMSRGSAPLPLPAPTPVNANWSGPPGTGSLGSGR
jgi:hypothetical protein